MTGDFYTHKFKRGDTVDAGETYLRKYVDLRDVVLETLAKPLLVLPCIFEFFVKLEKFSKCHSVYSSVSVLPVRR